MTTSDPQVDFWSHNPCGIDGNFSAVMQQRFRIEPWLPRELRKIPRNYKKYLEVGCGQGVDSFYVCKHLTSVTEYVAIDYSEESVKRAIRYSDEAIEKLELDTVPVFTTGDAMNLEFVDNYFDYVYSMGVIHHTPAPQQAINEIHRVLRSGGCAKIFLYRKNSLKVGVAKLLRELQKSVDRMLSTDRIVYNMINGKKSNFFGSMFLECFGVPWLESYSDIELYEMFKNFSKVDVKPYGFNMPRSSGKEVDGYNKFGYFFKIEVEK